MPHFVSIAGNGAVAETHFSSNPSFTKPGFFRLTTQTPKVGELHINLASLSNADIGEMMMDGENLALVARPRLENPVLDAGVLTVTPCPIGTVIEMHDLSGQEVMMAMTVSDDTLPTVFSLTDAGAYAVEILPPMPHLPVMMRFSIE